MVHGLCQWDGLSKEEAEYWKYIVKHVAHSHAQMLASGQGHDYDSKVADDRRHGYRGVVGPIKEMIVWAPNSGYIVSSKDCDPTHPLTFEWPDPIDRNKLLI